MEVLNTMIYKNNYLKILMIIIICMLFSIGSFAQQVQKLKIMGLTVEGLISADTSIIISNSGLQVGTEITGDDLQNSIKQLWSLKIFSDVQILLDQKVGDNVFLTLRVIEYPRLDKLEFNGNKKLKKKDIEEILDFYPDLPRKQRETRILLEKAPAVFIIGIGWPLKDGYPHEMRAADYDDWATETIVRNGEQYHGLNGDILVWNPVTKRRHELTSMGIRVTKETLKLQLKMSGQEDFLSLPYHQALLNDEIPLSIGGGIGQSRTFMYLLRTAHLGEVSVTVWPKVLKDICAKKNIQVLE